MGMASDPGKNSAASSPGPRLRRELPHKRKKRGSFSPSSSPSFLAPLPCSRSRDDAVEREVSFPRVRVSGIEEGGGGVVDCP